MDVESLSLDLDVLLYTIRSSNEISDINTIEKEIKATKQKIIEINPLFQVLESYFVRNNIERDIRNLYYQKELDSCLNELRHMTADIVKCHQALNYPLPNWLMSQVVLAEDNIDEELQFEVNLFNWIMQTKNQVGDVNKLMEVKAQEGFNDLNLSIPPNQILNGFLTFDVISDKWNYRDLRIHRKIDTLVNREWSKLLLGFEVRVEFMTGKIGVILVTSNKQD